MMTLMTEGGFPMWFILVFGLVGLVQGGLLVARPERRALARLWGFGIAVIGSAVAGTAAALGAVFHAIPAHFADDPKMHLVLLQGLGESTSPAILGFTFIALMALVGGVGAGRISPSEA